MVCQLEHQSNPILLLHNHARGVQTRPEHWSHPAADWPDTEILRPVGCRILFDVLGSFIGCFLSSLSRSLLLHRCQRMGPNSKGHCNAIAVRHHSRRIVPLLGGPQAQSRYKRSSLTRLPVVWRRSISCRTGTLPFDSIRIEARLARHLGRDRSDRLQP